MPSVSFGNTSPTAGNVDGNTVSRFEIPEGLPLSEALTSVARAFNGDERNRHSTEPPAWVESDDAGLASAFASEFGCKVGRPKSWKGLDFEEGVK